MLYFCVNNEKCKGTKNIKINKNIGGLFHEKTYFFIIANSLDGLMHHDRKPHV